MKSNHRTHLNRRESLRLLGFASLAALAGCAHAEAVPTALPPAAPPAAFYRFRIGASQALVLNDGFLPGPIHPFLAPEGTSAEVIELLAANFQSPITAQIPVNVLLVQLGREWVLFDAGSGSGFGPSTGQLQKSLAAAGVRPEQISTIFLTHAHPDHIGGLIDTRTKELLFPRARLFIDRREFDYWMSPSPDLSRLRVNRELAAMLLKTAQTALATVRPKLEFVAPGERVLEDVELIDAAGHTPGHLAYAITSGGERLLNIVDSAHHEVLMFAHLDWTMAGDTDPKQASATRKRLFNRAAAERTRIFAAHFGYPSLGFVRRTRESYEFVADRRTWS
jgi:glyoxylase-like metal-dependent hydrolase (beta-lactamase superfamily II)